MRVTKGVHLAAVLVTALLLQLAGAPTALALGDFSPTSPVMATPIAMDTEQLAPGAVHRDYTYNDRDGQRNRAHVLDLDMAHHPELSLGLTLPNDGKNTPWYGMQPMTQQAAAVDRPGHRVVAAVNGDYYNMADGYPVGVVVKDGQVIKSDMRPGWSFFGIRKDGSYVMGDATVFAAEKDNLQTALGGDAQYIKNGARDEGQISYRGSSSAVDPRIGVGIRRDGSVFFLEVDGRQTGFSRGLDSSDFADLMLANGAYQGLHLDGGGSATVVTRVPGTSDLTVVNSPSDGSERPVADGLVVVSKAQETGQFATAAVTPNGRTVTPNSTVRFEAKGQDATGAPAPLPADGLTWSLSDPSFGTIDAQGAFTSTGKQGQVQALASHGGKVVGSAWVEIAVPDSVSFGQGEISLDYGAVRRFGLVARHQGRDVQLKPGDITWSGIPDGMGTMDDANVFHAASTGTFDATVTATVTGTDTSASLHVLLGQLPVVLYDFEQGIDDWSPSTAGRGEQSSLHWNTYPKDVTRFGDHAMQMNFDFTTGQVNTTLGAYAGPSTSKDIPGRPKAIGAWVYGTPEAQGYWLRCYIYDAKGALQPINFTLQGTGVDWLGWKYVEAPIPDTLVGPFRTYPRQMFRLMSLKSGAPNGNPMRKGSIAFDNVRVTYGASVDDMSPPRIEPINVDGKTFTQSQVEISTSFAEDTTDKYATGINYDRVRVFVDGKEYTNTAGVYALNKGLNTVGLSHLSFPDGLHRVDVTVQDNFGNEASRTGYFTVDTGQGPSLRLTPSAKEAGLGKPYTVTLDANSPGQITGGDLTVRIGKDFPLTGVTFAPSAAGSTYTYDPATGLARIHLVNSGGGSAPATLATLSIGVPGTLAPGSQLQYELVSGAMTLATPPSDTYAATFGGRPETVPVVAALKLTPDPLLVGRPGAVTVTDASGAPVAGATVTMVDAGVSTDLGVTDAKGRLSSDALTTGVRRIDLFATKDGGYSFRVATQALAGLRDAVPSSVLAGATKDARTMKTFTWMANPLQTDDAAQLQVATKADYDAKGDAAFTTVSGTAKELVYSGDADLTRNGIVRVGSATATGLAPGTAYAYRVGDGKTWSPVSGFTTHPDNLTRFGFTIFGDTQSPDAAGLAGFDAILSGLDGQPAPAFAIHVGDYTDDAGRWTQLDSITSMLAKHPSVAPVDMVHVLGNHEYMGDDGTKAAALFGQPGNGSPDNPRGTASMDYGTMHIATIGWTDDPAVLAKEIDWLRKDMAASNRLWKVVVTHQPPYPTNPEDSKLFEPLAKACDDLGIDLVLSGHDHAYGRTQPLQAGAPKPGGTTYVVTGTTGPKHYTAVNDGHFEVMTDKGQPMYLQASVAEGQLTVRATWADGTLADEFTLDKSTPAPVVTVSGVRDGGAYRTPVTPKVDVASAAPGPVTTTLDGAAWDGSAISTEGRHELRTVATDQTGTRTENVVHFVIDTTAPEVTVSGLTDGQQVEQGASLHVTHSGTDALSGIESTSSTLLAGDLLDTSATGTRTVTFTATDKAGNVTTRTVHYTVVTYLSTRPAFHPLGAPVRGELDPQMNGTAVSGRMARYHVPFCAPTEFAGSPTHVLANVTIDRVDTPTYLRVGQTGPSILNAAAGQRRTNQVILPLESVHARCGAVEIGNSAGNPRVILDVVGWYGVGRDGSGLRNAVRPARVLDTRFARPQVPSGGFRDVRIPLASLGANAGNTTGVTVNLTVPSPSGSGWLQAYNPDVPVPPSSVLNYAKGSSVAALTTVRPKIVGTDAIIRVRNSGPAAVDLVVDHVSSYTSSAAERPYVFRPAESARLLDTRPGGLGPRGQVEIGQRTRAYAAAQGAPAGAIAYGNLTLVTPSASTWLQLGPVEGGAPRYGTSSVNASARDTIANAAVVPDDADGVYLRNDAGRSNALYDVFGLFVRP